MNFRYKAINKDNKTIEGVESANTKFELSNFLKSQGLVLVEAEETSTKKKFDFKKLSEIGTVSTQTKISFARNVGAMIEAGLSLSRALSVMEKQSNNKRFKKILSEINASVKKGASLSDAISKYPKIFSHLFVSMVRSGEESGNLTESLKEVASQTEKIYLLKKKIRGAMIYPGVIVTAMLIIGVFMMIYIVPTLTETFDGVGSELPASTKFIIGMSDFFQNNLFLGLILIFVAFVGLYLMTKSKKGKMVIDFTLLHFPIVKNLVKETNSARTTRTLASLLKAGVPYLKAIQITKETVTNSFYIKVIEQVEKQIEMGLPVSKVFEENQKLYPPFVSEMFAVGEETGELSPMLLKIAEFYENEVEEKTKNLSTIVEPVLMIIVGAVVGFFAISMVSPMYSLVSEF
jgi:type IV pilus assembly protein PilC